MCRQERTHLLTQHTTNKKVYLPVDKLVKNDDLTGMNVLSKWPNSRRYDNTAASFFLQRPYVSTIVHIGWTDGVFSTMPDSNNPPLSITTAVLHDRNVSNSLKIVNCCCHLRETSQAG